MQYVTNTPSKATSLDSQILAKEERLFLNEWTSTDVNELQRGMITSAINDVRDGRKSKKMQQEAIEWIVSDCTLSPFSFVNCCSALNFDEIVLRNMLNRLLQGGLYK